VNSYRPVSVSNVSRKPVVEKKG